MRIYITLLILILAGTVFVKPAYAADTWCLKDADKNCEKITTGSCLGTPYPTEPECKVHEVGQSSDKKWCVTGKDICGVVAAASCATPYESMEACAAGLDAIAEDAANQGKVQPATGAKGNTVDLINPIGGKDGSALDKQGVTDLYKITGKIISSVLGILGSLALLVFIYGGFEWVTAAGNSEKISSGASAMTWAVIGICIIFSSYAIINLIFSTLIGTKIAPPAAVVEKTVEEATK